MSKTKLEDFKKYNWKNVFPSDKKNIFYSNSDQELFLESVKNFANEFSPKQGFLGLKGRKTRTRKDSIEFIANTGLADNKKEAERFLDAFKDKDVKVSGDWYFKLTELRNFNKKYKYKAVTEINLKNAYNAPDFF